MLPTRLKNLAFRYKKSSLLMGFICLMMVSYGLYSVMRSPAPKPQDAKVVEVETVQLKDIQQTAQFIGTIKSEQSTMLIAKTHGILDRFVNAGQRVKKGELIAKIENNDLERNYKLSQEMEKIAKLQYGRFNELHKTGVTSKNAVEEKQSVWIEYQKKMSDAKIAMDYIYIYAPFDGIVGVFKIREGSQVQVGDALVTLYDPSKTIVEFDVPISIVKLVHDGTPVFINQKQYPLTHIQRILDEETHMSPAYVRIECDNCIIGGTVDVNLVINEKRAVIVIPEESIFLRNSKTFVYIVKDGKTVLTPVELGIREKESIEIARGLNPNDQVIIRGQGRLYPNASVKMDSDKKNNIQDKT